MFKELRYRIRDLLRGYTDADVMTLMAKLHQAKSLPPGSLVELTNGEMKAMQRSAQMALP